MIIATVPALLKILLCVADVTAMIPHGGGQIGIALVQEARVRHWAPRQDWAEIVITESGRHGIDPTVVVRIIRVESRWLPQAVNRWSGASGLMQVRPSIWLDVNLRGWPFAHFEGAFPECGLDLLEPSVNICYGASILAYYLRINKGDLTAALNGYWGCRRCGSEPSGYTERVE